MRGVIDCSVVLAWFFADEKTTFTDSLLGGIGAGPVWVPALWPSEFVNALLSAERRKRIDRKARHAMINAIQDLPFHVDREAVPLAVINQVAEQYELTAYDAAYFELAQRRNLALVTLDKALVRAARVAKHPLLTDLERFPES